MVKPYRLKHKASGLYYQPFNGSTNLGKDGEVWYNDPPLLLAKSPFYISIRRDSSIYKRLRDMLAKYVVSKDDALCATSYWIPKTEFEKEEL